MCLRDEGYEVSLEKRKIYEGLPDLEAKHYDQIRVTDESGEDYLYPESLFVEIELPQPLRTALTASVQQCVAPQRPVIPKVQVS